LVPCDFFLFSKIKLKLKGRRFDTIKEIQAKSHRVLDTLIEEDFRKCSRNGGDSGTGVYMREGTTSRVTVAERPYGEFYDFYSISLENFGSTLVYCGARPCEHHHIDLKRGFTLSVLKLFWTGAKTYLGVCC
jgi:hypothetical protein